MHTKRLNEKISRTRCYFLLLVLSLIDKQKFAFIEAYQVIESESLSEEDEEIQQKNYFNGKFCEASLIIFSDSDSNEKKRAR